MWKAGPANCVNTDFERKIGEKMVIVLVAIFNQAMYLSYTHIRNPNKCEGWIVVPVQELISGLS